MDKDSFFSQEESEYISIDKLKQSLIQSEENLSNMALEISMIYQKCDNIQMKSKFKSYLKEQLSSYSSKLNDTLMNMSFNEDGLEIGGVEELEEQKQNSKYQVNRGSESQKEMKKSQIQIDNRIFNNYDQQENMENLVQQNQFQPNFYNDLKNIQFSRELNYFNKQDQQQQVKDEQNQGRDSQDEFFLDKSDTLGNTAQHQYVINDEIYQKRQSEKKQNNQINSNFHSICSNFIQESPKRDDNLNGQKSEMNKSSLIKQSDGVNNRQDLKDKNQNNNENQSNFVSRQQDNDEVEENNQNDGIQNNHRQNIEGQQQNVNQQRQGENQGNMRIIKQKQKWKIVKLAMLFLLLGFFFLYTYRNMTNNKQSIQEFINSKYTQLFTDHQKDIQIKELKASLLQKDTQIIQMQNDLKQIKGQSATKIGEYNKTLAYMKETLQLSIAQMNELKQELAQKLNSNESLQKELNNLKKQYEEVKQLYDNLCLVVELYKKSTQ